MERRDFLKAGGSCLAHVSLWGLVAPQALRERFGARPYGAQVRVERNGSLIATRGAGEFFGEMALVSEGTRMASATCETDCKFLVLGHREFHSLMDEFPELKMRVLETLAQRVRTLDTSAVH